MNCREGRRAIVATPLAVALILSLGGCAKRGLPETEPSIRGVVTSIDGTADGGSIRVVWTQGPLLSPQLEYDAAQVSLDSESRLYAREAEDRLTEIEFDDIRLGDVVEAWFSGAVAESYPVQAGASHLVVIGRHEGELPEPPGLTAPE